MLLIRLKYGTDSELRNKDNAKTVSNNLVLNTDVETVN